MSRNKPTEKTTGSRNSLLRTSLSLERDDTYDLGKQFVFVQTSGYKNWCGFFSIVNYVKYLEVDKRMAFYKKLFTRTGDNHPENKLEIFDDNGDINKQSRCELLILETFLRLREQCDFSQYVDQREKLDREIFSEAIELYREKYQLDSASIDFENLDYENFIQKYKIINTSDSEFKSTTSISYQLWVAEFLRRMTGILQGKIQYPPTDPTDQVNEPIRLDESSNISSDQRDILFNHYFKEKPKARIQYGSRDYIEIAYPEIAYEDLECFHRAMINIKSSQDQLSDDEKLFHELYCYFLEKYIPKTSNQSQPLNQITDGQILSYKHFYKKTNYDKFCKTIKCDLTVIIAREIREGQDRNDISELIKTKIKEDGGIEKVNQTLLKVIEHFKREFSFEKQFLNLLHSDTFLTDASGFHYTTIKFENPFPDGNSFLDIKTPNQLEEPKHQKIAIQEKNFREALKLNSQNYDQLPRSTSSADRAMSKLINSHHLTSFQRLHGRKDNNFSYEANQYLPNFRSLDRPQQSSPFSKINSIIKELKRLNNLSDEELALAIFLSKKFGGIGTKSQQILDYYQKNKQPVKDFLENNNSEILKKMINFSYQFQQQCQGAGIYSGNEKLKNDDEKKRFGLRLSFIPDEIFRLHLNKLSHDSYVKKFIIDQVKDGQTSKY